MVNNYSKKKTIRKNKLLFDKYYNIKKPSALGGVSKLGIKNLKKANNFLHSQRVYTLHKRRINKFQTKPVIVRGPYRQYQSDIIDLKKYAKFNNGFRYILNIIDVFSKYGYAIPMKTKTANETSAAFEKILTKKNIPKTLQVDRDKAFLGHPFLNMLKKHKIKIFHTNTKLKASIIERFNRTLLDKIFKMFTARNTYTWFNVLNTIVNTYNKTVHSTTKFKPQDVNHKNAEEIWINTHFRRKPLPEKSPKFKTGDIVRISRDKDKFEKGYLTNFSEELFKVKKKQSGKPNTYQLEDLKGAIIEGQFYEPELVKYNFKNEKEPFIIDAVLKEKGNRLFVSWKGYGKEFDSWIPKSYVKKNLNEGFLHHYT